jgi:hypothetical protein
MKNLLLPILVLLFAAGCKKEVDALPEPTQTGAHTFGARLNGAFWVPAGFGFASTKPVLEATFTDTANSVIIHARNFSQSPKESEIELYIKNITGPGVYLLNSATNNYPYQSASYGYYTERKFMPLNEWITGSQQTGRVVITRFDIPARIISGTFEFTAASKDGTADPVTLSEGRFDVKIL